MRWEVFSTIRWFRIQRTGGAVTGTSRRLGAIWVALSLPLVAADEFFETKIRPILANNCYACHTASQLGDLRVDSREALLKGGKSGPAIAPGDPEQSLLIIAIRQTNDKLKMPMGGKLKKDEVDALTEWVRGGAVWPETPKGAITAPASGEYVITQEQRGFWSF